LSSLGIDYLKQFPELDEYRVEAADGHFIQHACNTEKNSKGRVFAAGFIHALNLRDGLLRPLCVVTNGSERHQEIPALRSYIEQRPDKKSIGQKHLYVYDKAVTDFAYRDPETGQLHPFISTLPKSINPGTIAMLYYKRWTIEKVFNHSKSDLTKRKAWSSNLNALNSQMRFTAMAYNIMRVFEEISKARSPERIHPSDKKHHAALNKRQVIAWEKGGFVNPLFFHARIVRVCSFTIRSVQNAIMTGRTLIDIMGSLTRHLKPRVREYSGTLMIRTHIKAVLIIQQERNVT
jgi:hypothetical protein